MLTFVKLSVIGIIAGVCSGLFGIGGGVVIVPALVYFCGYEQHLATGTSLAVLLPPIGIAATLEYYRHGNVDLMAAMVIAVTMIGGGWLGAHFANNIRGPHLQLLFGIFVILLGVSVIIGAVRQLSQG